jgi:proteasome lid subunit RPN8/RPN11
MSVAAGAVRLPAAMRDEIIAHARAEFPRECCGVISGAGGVLFELHRLTNTYPGVDFYEPEAGELYRLLTELDRRGHEVTAIYHSHPVSPAYPSPRDVEYAGWPDSAYLICSLQEPDAPMLRAFRIADGDVSELGIELEQQLA